MNSCTNARGEFGCRVFVFRADLQREEAREIADEAHSSLSQFQRRMQLRVQEVQYLQCALWRN